MRSISKAKRLRDLWEALPIGVELEVRLIDIQGVQVDYDLSPFMIVEKPFDPLVVVTLRREKKPHLFKLIDRDGVLLFRGLTPNVWKHKLDVSRFNQGMAGHTISFLDPLFQLLALMNRDEETR